MEGKSPLPSQNFTTMNKTKSREPTKKKRGWPTPSKIPEPILDSNSDESESGTVTAKEHGGYEEAGTERLLQGGYEEAGTERLLQEGYEEAGTNRLLQEKYAPSHIWSTEYSRVQAKHSPISPSSYGEDDDNDDDEGEENRSHRQTSQQQTTAW